MFGGGVSDSLSLLTRTAAMFSYLVILIMPCFLSGSGLGPSGDDKEVVDQVHEVRIALRLNAIQASKLLERYERYVTQEMNIQMDIRVARPTETRLPEWHQHLTDTQTELETIKKKLIALDAERAKLAKRLGKQNRPDEALDPTKPTTGLLEKMLERLENIEKRLEKIEQRR
jgi:hypothetical protein